MWWCCWLPSTDWLPGIKMCKGAPFIPVKCGSLSLKVNQHITSAFILGKSHILPPSGLSGSASKTKEDIWVQILLSAHFWPLKHLHNKFAGHCLIAIFSPKDVLVCILRLCWTFYSVNKWQILVMAALQIDHPGWGHGTNLGQAFIRSRAVPKQHA